MAGSALDRMRSSLEEVTSLMPGLAPGQARRAAAGEWTAGEVMSHLADAELVYGFRIRLMLTRERPPLTAFDQDAWVRRFAVADDPQSALARWRALRQSNLRLLDSLSESEWRRAGLHEERGETTVAEIAETMAAHDEGHLAQIQAAARP